MNKGLFSIPLSLPLSPKAAGMCARLMSNSGGGLERGPLSVGDVFERVGWAAATAAAAAVHRLAVDQVHSGLGQGATVPIGEVTSSQTC